MERLDFIIRRYKQIIPDPVTWVQESILRELRVWLTDDVCPVIEEYALRPAFREHAMWVIRMLDPKAQTAERREIEAVEEALVRYAQALSKLAARAGIRNQLAILYPPQERVVEESCTISDEGMKRQVIRKAPVDVLSMELSQIGLMARHHDVELVNVNDYFEPVQEFVQGADGQRIQRGELIVSLTPELHPVGNFVVHSMFRRLDLMLANIDAVRRKVLHVQRELGRTYRVQEEMEQAWSALQTAHDALQKTHKTGANAPLRDSCMILTQILAAFHPAPDLGWLPLSQQQIDRAVPLLKHRITHFRNADMFERVVKAIGDLRRLYVGNPPTAAKDEAIATGGLVIDARIYEVFWERTQVDVEWSNFPKRWHLLLALSRKSTHQGHVTEADIYGTEVVSQSTMGTNSERLKELLPASLRKWIIPDPTARTYRLDLQPNQIHLFE